MSRKKPYLFKVFVFSAVIFPSMVICLSYAEDFAFLNGPSIGLADPIEGIDEGLTTDAGFMLSGNAGFKYGKGPFLADTNVSYGRGGYSEKHRSTSTDVNYDRCAVEVAAGYRLKSEKPFSLYYCGRASYSAGKRERSSSGVYFYWYSGPEAPASIRDDGDCSTLNFTGGPALVVHLDRFFLYGYAGLGIGRVAQSGYWVMTWSPPAPPGQDITRYEDTAFGVSFAGIADARFALSKRFGFNVGFKAFTFPGAVGHAYIPESYFRHWGWGTVNVALWVGPSFAL